MELNEQLSTNREVEELGSRMETENGNEDNLAAVNPECSTSSAQPTFEKFMKLRKNPTGKFSKSFMRKKKKKEDKYAVFGKFVAQELRSLHLECNRKRLKLLIQKAILKVSALEDSSGIYLQERNL